MRIARVLMAPLMPFISDSSADSAETQLHVMLSDDAPNHSGAYFSQSNIIYRDSECKNGGWPMETPNPNAKDMEKAQRLVEISRSMVGLDASASH